MDDFADKSDSEPEAEEQNVGYVSEVRVLLSMHESDSPLYAGIVVAKVAFEVVVVVGQALRPGGGDAAPSCLFGICSRIVDRFARQCLVPHVIVLMHTIERVKP